MIGWLVRAQEQGRLAECDIDTLTATILGALQGWAFEARITGEAISAPARERFVEQFVELLWDSIGGRKS